MSVQHFNIKGLNDQQVAVSRGKFGNNALSYKKEATILDSIKGLAKEPMIALLVIASLIYFINGRASDGFFLILAIALIAAISIYQDSRSRNALQKLKNFTQPNCRVIRNGSTIEIKSEEIVVGDSLIVEEGTSVVADGIIVHSNDFSVNESVLTGESLPIFKDKTHLEPFIYKGTTVESGLAIVRVTHVGNQSRLGKIGVSLEAIKEEKSPLEIQINTFVKKMVVIGALVFMVVWGINYVASRDLLESLLQALTLAMSILPEEIPVAFTVFMALGAWRLMKMQIVVKQIKTVETLGSATVICIDKTGTITENRMALAKLFTLSGQRISTLGELLGPQEKELIETAMWASEPIAFDPMELALHKAYGEFAKDDDRADFKMVHEYPLDGKPPMMTHVFRDEKGRQIVAAKGAPEALMNVCDLTEVEKQKIEDALLTITKEGYRVLGVGQCEFSGTDYPKTQQEFPFVLKGIVAFYDPPKANIAKVMQDFYRAGIAVKILTGDNSATTQAIAKQISFKGADKSLTGEQLMGMSEMELQDKVMETTIFTRMFPEAKLRIINALKANGQVVAMTGDGVNDGPALKAAHIGIAMGKKGTEIAKQAASLILLEDDLSKMVIAVAQGRKIYANLKKAIRYIISIHVPIMLTVFLPLLLGWEYPNIFSPVQVIFLELIMGPTCSIVFENEPIEKNSMLHKPRPFNATFFNGRELAVSIFQGLAITCGTLFVYRYAADHYFGESYTRTMVFTVLIAANVFLTLQSRSFYYSIFTTLRYENRLVPLVIALTVSITGLLLFVPSLTAFFGFARLSVVQILGCVCVAFVCVFWYELVKLEGRQRKVRA
ncbi:cation-translocating P-type ATPase [Pedobacter insulae]|uniref:Ca2+-transporting ATPase n=1 Tax=Pedobacter insulae TaxID=414048 RepID=A0A1I2WET7_9SPHI|nr:cation-translocating P-type ATPase [Pedobacter insulae]SFG99832.1 Ca2+-transporting ATPase [Pedobacter insulae]